MSANTSDLITDTRNAARPNSTTVSAPRSTGATSLSCANLTGWPIASKVHFVTYKIDSNSAVKAGTQLDCYGIVSGNTIGSFTVVDGTDSGNAIGDIVEMLPTAAWGQDLATGLLVGHTRAGAHASALPLTSPVLTTPAIADFTSAGHTHASAAQGGKIGFSALSAGTTRLGLNNNSGGALTTLYQTFATVTATSTGGVCEATFNIQANNSNSGVFVTMDIQVLCDGAAITPASLSYNLPFVSGASPNYSYSYIMSSTPTAGSHTWALQIKCNQNSTSTVVNNQLKVSEVV